jgi:hypothetical protein
MDMTNRGTGLGCGDALACDFFWRHGQIRIVLSRGETPRYSTTQYGGFHYILQSSRLVVISLIYQAVYSFVVVPDASK